MDTTTQPRPAVALPVTNTSDAGLLKFKGVIYGLPGAGKTTLARTLLQLGRVLIVSCESGLAPLKGYSIDVYPCKNYADLANFMGYAAQGALEPYDVIFVDSLTEIGKIFDQNLFSRFAVMDESTGVYDVPKANSFKYYGALARDLEGFCRAVRDMNKHVFFTALAQSQEDKNTGLTLHRPALIGQKVNELLPGLFDFIFAYRRMPHPETGEDSRILWTQPYEGWFAKARDDVRCPTVPMAIVEPNLAEIVTKIIEATP